MLIRIPTQHKGHSTNLAQSVMIVCYELLLGNLEREPARIIRLASLEQVEAMYAQLEKALLGYWFPATSERQAHDVLITPDAGQSRFGTAGRR